jgi:hypothetical protein
MGADDLVLIDDKAKEGEYLDMTRDVSFFEGLEYQMDVSSQSVSKQSVSKQSVSI